MKLFLPAKNKKNKRTTKDWGQVHLTLYHFSFYFFFFFSVHQDQFQHPTSLCVIYVINFMAGPTPIFRGDGIHFEKLNYLFDFLVLEYYLSSSMVKI